MRNRPGPGAHLQSQVVLYTLRFAPLILIAIGLALRIYGYNFDDGQLIQPDESAIDQTVVSLGCCVGHPTTTPWTWPSPLTHFFDPSLAPYNPHLFNYGSLPLYLLAVVTRFAAWLGRILPPLLGWRPASDLVHTNWIGRWLSALFDVGSLALTYRLARLIFDRPIALLALFFCTFSVLQIQLSHFYAVDTILTFFVLLTLYAAIRIARDGQPRWYVLSGIAFGAALATKTSSFPLVIPIVASSAFSLCTSRGSHGIPPLRHGLQAVRRRPPVLQRTLGLLFLALVLTVLTFAVCEPYGIIDHAQLLADVQTQNGIIVSHSIPAPYTIQFVGTPVYLFYIKNMVLWYLGPALGISALVGTVWFLWRNLTRRIVPAQALLLLWVIPYFVIVGQFWAKFGRYLLPITPILTIFGAAFLVFILRKLPYRWRPAGWSGLAVLALFTTGWALAFMHIYATTNSQVAASRWIYTHVKPNTPFATEGAWDRSLPLCLPQPKQCPGGYNSYQLNLYSPDNRTKVNRLVHALTHDRFIVMSTQRFIDSIPKVPQTYPITVRYYRLLFHDDLNFRLEKRFAVHPQIGPWVFDDFSADENFTVFDHPDVRIFARTHRISANHARYLLTHKAPSGISSLPEADGLPPSSRRFGLHTDIDRRVSMALLKTRGPGLQSQLPPVNATRHRQDKRLMLNQRQWSEDQRAPTYNQMFPPHGFGMSHPILVWLALVEVVSFCAFPISFYVCSGLTDRGWIVAKTLGIILLGWAAWVLASTGLLSFSQGTIAFGILMMAVVGSTCAWLQRKALLDFIRSEWPNVVTVEVIFLLGFLLFVILRMWYPDLGHQFSPVSPHNIGSGRMGEKQLELGFLNAIARSQTFPPLDPFFAGGYINYYYFGYVIVGALCKVTTIAPSTGFNLAIAMFFGLFLATAYSIGRSLTSSVFFGLVAAVFSGLIGNLNSLVQVIQDLQAVASVHVSVPMVGGVVELLDGLYAAVVLHRPLPTFDFWGSTRLVPPVGIDFAEFPYFTYLFGDLHAHLMAFPMDMAVMAMGVGIVLSREQRSWKRTAVTMGVAGIVLGAIEATNPLDFPTFLLILALALLTRYVFTSRKPSSVAPNLQRAGNQERDGETAPSWRVTGDSLTPVSAMASLLRTIGWSALSVLAALVLFPPIIQGYHPVFSTGLATVSSAVPTVASALRAENPGLAGSRLASDIYSIIVTPLSTYWEIFGLFLFIIVTWLILSARESSGTTITGQPVKQRWRGWRLASTLFTLACLVVLMSLDLWLLAFCCACIALTGYVLWVRRFALTPVQAWILAILFVPFLLTVFTEAFFVRDYLSSGLAFRMNTVAKLYNQIWLLFAVCASFALCDLLSGLRDPSFARTRKSLWSRVLTKDLEHLYPLWVGALSVMLAGCLFYLYAGTMSRETYRQTWLPESSVPFTLNGMAFMKVAYPGDFAGIDWLNAHVRGTPVITEADQADYNWRSRVVQFTGLPTLFGGIYEPAQRYSSEVAPRQAVLEEIYSASPKNVTPGTAKEFGIRGCSSTGPSARCITLRLLRMYHVSYVYDGLMERQLWPSSEHKFSRMRWLHRVFHKGNVSIYHVRESPR